jgi:ABC-2 type transport system permease protein
MSTLVSRFSAGIFLTGKIFRFVFFIIFLLTIFSQTRVLAGYTSGQALFFFLTFNIIDTITQLFFREAYRFRPLVVSGDFDLVLAKPVNPLFRALAGGADPLDLIMLVPYLGALIYVAMSLPSAIGFVNVMSYLVLVFNGLVIATGFHILVLSLAVVTTEIDHAIMIYRDLTAMGRVPVDVYRPPLRGILTFIVPVGIMMTFPARAFLGLLSLPMALLSLLIGTVFCYACVKTWHYALRHYASASS